MVSSHIIDFQVLFNPSQYQGNSVTLALNPLDTFASQAAFDKEACPPQKGGTTLPSSAGFAYTSGANSIDLTTATGIAINGVVIMASASMNNVDPFYPRWWPGASSVSAELVDGCLAHPQDMGIYHYHILSPCLLNAANVQSTQPCAHIASCASNITMYSLNNYGNSKVETLLGLAKDGHMILGPYHDDGTLYDCTAYDQCGGTTSADGSYVYIFSNKYPYINDCYGPAPPKVYQASCSQNTCIWQSSGLSLTALISSVIMVFAMVILF